MSTFWETVQNQVESAVVETPVSNFWASIIMRDADTKKVKAEKVIKPAKKSKAVDKAVTVYETVEGLVTPSVDCVHYWIIDSTTPQAIGVCKLCNGEKWFTNVYKDNFNDSPIYSTADVGEIRDAEKLTSAVQDNAITEESV